MSDLAGAVAVATGTLLCFIVPGLTWGPLLAPGRLDDLGSLARAVGSSVVVAGIVATALAAGGMLGPGTGLAALLIATVVPLASRTVRNELAHMLRGRRRPAAIGLFVLALGAIAVHLALTHARLGPESLPATSTVWYYRHLAELVAGSGGFPAAFPEWGDIRPFHTDYLPFTAHSALAFSLMGLDRVGELEAYRLAIVAGTVLVSLLFFRRWMPTWIAIAGALLLVTTVRMDSKLLSYKPETFGLLIGLFGLWLVDRAAVERSPRIAASAALAMGLMVMSHAEVAIVLLPAVVAIAVARGIGRPAGHGLGLVVRRDRRAQITTLVPIVITVVGLGGGLVANALLTGESGLVGYVTGQASGSPAEVVIDESMIPDGWRLTADPTWNFHTAAVNRAGAGTAPPTAFTDRRLLSRANLHVWALLDARTTAGAVLLAALLLVPLAAWSWLDARRRSFVLVGGLFAIGLLAGAWLLNEISATYVPRRIGARRLVPYELLVPVGAAMVALWLASRPARRLADRLRLSRRSRWLAAGVAVTLVSAGALVPVVAAADEEESGGLSPAGAEAYAWLRDNLPEGSRVLANAYTDGSLTLLSGQLGVLDGRAVYLEDPAFLSEATNLLLGGRRFFADPDAPASAEYLALTDPDYLLVATRPTGVDLGGYRPFVTDLAALDTDPRFEVVADLADGGLRLYRVLDDGASG